LAAIDPGKAGGVALYRRGRFTSFPLPAEAGELAAMLEDVDQIFIEDVPCFCGTAVPSHTAFKLGKSCGMAETVAELSGAYVHRMKPWEWQKVAGMKREPGETAAKWKARLKSRAQYLTGLKLTLKTADAALLLWVGIQTLSGAHAAAGDP
jgi:hypothetical protein